MAKRKPTEPALWMASLETTNTRTGRVEYGTMLTPYAHKTRQAAINELEFYLDRKIRAPHTYRIVDLTRVSWSWIRDAFKDFISFDDDDSGGGNDDAPIAPDAPEDHGVEIEKVVPLQFAQLIDSLDVDL